MTKLFKIILNIARSMAVPVFNFLIAIIAIKYLGATNWSDFIQILLWVYFVAFIANFGNKDFLLRAFSKNPSKIDSNFAITFSSRSVFLILSFSLLLFFPLNIALLAISLSILIFSYQSLESLVIYKQKFLAQLIAEISGFLIICLFIFNNEQVQTRTLLIAYCLAFFVKFVIVLIAVKMDFKQIEFRFSLAQIKQLIPFFLIGFSGWLASKIDLYIVNIYVTNDYLAKEMLAKYQLLITAFLMLQGFAAFIIYPFTKHLFRLQSDTIIKIKRILAIVSIPLVVICTLVIWFILEQIIKLNLDINLYILGAFSSLPIYFFMIDIFIFYKEKKEKLVMYINFIAAFISLILSLILIPLFGIKGAIISVLITQTVLLLFYKLKIVR